MTSDDLVASERESVAGAEAPDGPAKSVCLALAAGCQRGEAHVGRLVEYVRANGWPIAATVEEADVVVVWTCGYDAEREERCVSMLRSVEQRRQEGSHLVIVGCLAGINEERLHQTFNAVTVPPKRLGDLDAVLGAVVPFEDVRVPWELAPYVAEASGHFTEAERHPEDSMAMRHARSLLLRSGIREWYQRTIGRENRAYLDSSQRVCSIRVAVGCMGQCTYCAIRFAAGPLHSKPLDSVLAEFDEGLACGYTEFRLIAGDLGSYGQDLGTNIAELLDLMLRRPGNFKLNLLELDFRYFIKYQDRVVDLLAINHTRIRSITMPMQSGSERVLQKMRRGHTAIDAERALRAFRQACPSICANTHVLVGFPGETDADFEDTLRMLRVGRFNYVTVFGYTDRPRTEATLMPDKVQQSVIRARSLRARREFNGRLDALRYRAEAWGLR
jgi:tRNA A37 methylthiotransferase MiaB